MGGYPKTNLQLHRRDDKHYHKKRKELKKYIPMLEEHLRNMRTEEQTENVNYSVLNDFCSQLRNSSIRVPMHVLLRGEDLLRREILHNHEAKSSIVEAVWRSWGFRLAVQRKLEDTINEYGNDSGRSAQSMEQLIYARAKTKDDYLENAARIILYLRDVNYKQKMLAEAALSSAAAAAQQQQLAAAAAAAAPTAAMAAAGEEISLDEDDDAPPLPPQVQQQQQPVLFQQQVAAESGGGRGSNSGVSSPAMEVEKDGSQVLKLAPGSPAAAASSAPTS